MRVIGLAGWSGSGKTTLVTKVIPVLVKRGLKLATSLPRVANRQSQAQGPCLRTWRLRWKTLRCRHGQSRKERQRKN
jgi:molybdopterin-guanine dinucleotide biosynthesis protein B